MSRDGSEPVTWRDILSLSDRISRLEENVNTLNEELDKLAERIEDMRAEVKNMHQFIVKSMNVAKGQLDEQARFFRNVAKRIIYALIGLFFSVVGAIIMNLIK